MRDHVLPAFRIESCGISLKHLVLYILLITSFHMLDSFQPNLHNHLNNKALFLFLKDPVTKPPTLLERVIVLTS
jgi:hypothetical protein